MRRGRVVAAMVLTMLVPTVVPRRVTAFSYFQYGGVKVVWAGAQSLRYLSPSTFPANSDPDIHFRSAMGLWNLVPACTFEYFYQRLTQDFPVDHFDGFSDTVAVPASQLDPGVLGVTFLVNNGAQWYDMDMFFSDLPLGVGWTFEPNPGCDIVTQPTPNNGFSFLLVATHELGHALGLGHDPIGNESPGTPWFIATMNPRYPSGGPIGQENIIELHTDDRSGARFLYPHSGPSGPAYVDLAGASYASGPQIGKAIPVSFSPGSVNPGGEVIARSVIENLGTTNEFFVRQGFYLSVDEQITPSDAYLGSLLWDLAFEDALEFDVAIEMPADLAAGPYYLGSIFDDLDEVAEEYEDNNAVSYCTPLTVNRLAPVIVEFGQMIVPCGQPFTGPTPVVTHPLNMAPMTWSLDNPPAGMTIHPATGVISWPSPVHSPFLYTIIVRATNSSGTATQILFLGVQLAAPAIAPIADVEIECGQPYVGPVPGLTGPACMEPILAWSLDAGPVGMTISPATGQVSWANPVRSATPYTVTIRATNSSGSGSRSWTITVPSSGGDLDGDGSVNLTDFSTLAVCFTGGGTTPPAGCAPEAFAASDFDCDGDVDLADFSSFATTFGQ